MNPLSQIMDDGNLYLIDRLFENNANLCGPCFKTFHPGKVKLSLCLTRHHAMKRYASVN
jgi:hypothetical protein